MAISDAYSNTLKRRAIARFVSENERAPNESELADLVRREKQAFPSVDEVGISGYDITKPQYRDESSADIENANRHAVYDDMTTISQRLEDLTNLLEDSFRGFQGTARRTNRLLRQLEGRVDNLLLLNSEVDVFIHGIEETFDTQELIDFDETTASVEAGYVTLGRNGITPLDLSDVKIGATATSERGIIGSQTSSDINLLKEEDGSYWEHLVYSKSRQGRVSTLIELELPEALYVGDLRLTTSAISVNQKTTMTVFYSLDGQTYTALEPVETVLVSSENTFNIGVEGVKKIQILMSKTVSDNVTTAGNQYVYVFSLDSLKIFSDRYTDDKESVLIAGPYTITDEEGTPVLFTKATLSACVSSPEDTSVSFFLSKDKENWQSVNWRGDSVKIVSFADGSSDGTSFFVDETLSERQLTETAIGVEEIDFQTEALLNKAVHEDFSPVVPLRSIVIKRNTADYDSPESLYGVSPGWFFNPNTETYSTTVYVGASEGRTLDVGPTGLRVNGAIVTGLVELQQGYSVLETDDGNWFELPAGLSNVDQIINNDPLYPYNHKYLIQGYAFPSGFKGERIYTGVDEYFGSLLQYIPPERFNALENMGVANFGFYTLEDVDGSLYFKVKVDKTFASWRDERFDVDWVVQSDESSDIYVKAVLATSNTENTPKIEDYMVRVI